MKRIRLDILFIRNSFTIIIGRDGSLSSQVLFKSLSMSSQKMSNVYLYKKFREFGRKNKTPTAKYP